MFKTVFTLLTSVNALIDYSSPINGVSLGSWLTVEFFLTPSLFDNTTALTEYSLTSQLGKERSREVLEPHWDNFIQESDFAKMKSWGINFIRLPIGYYTFLLRENDPYVDGQLPYLDRAMEWARKYDIQVVIDLHVVPGWENFNNIDEFGIPWVESSSDIDDTVEVIRRIVGNATEKWEGAVVGIELLNEPVSPFDLPLGLVYDVTLFTQQFYTNLYSYYTRAMKEIPGDISIVINDYGQGKPDTFNWFLNDSRVSIDYHYYDISETNLFGSQPVSEDVPAACINGPAWYGSDPRKHIVGEFSGTRSECERVLSGFADSLPGCKGANDINSSYWTEDYRRDTRRYIEAQLDSFEHSGNGWVFWTYRTENRISIDMRDMIEYGMFPLPFGQREFPNQCNYSTTATTSQVSKTTSSYLRASVIPSA